MKVFSLEGNYGIGKSTLFEKMSKMDELNSIYFMNESFIELCNKNTDPNGIITEINWISSWFNRIIEYKNNGVEYVITDRSPYSPLFFTKTQHIDSLEFIIHDMINELKSYDVQLITLHLNTEMDVNWNRIMNRIEKEPKRRIFNEDNYDRFVLLYTKFNQFKWDIAVNNDEHAIDNILKIIHNYKYVV